MGKVARSAYDTRPAFPLRGALGPTITVIAHALGAMLYLGYLVVTAADLWADSRDGHLDNWVKPHGVPMPQWAVLALAVAVSGSLLARAVHDIRLSRGPRGPIGMRTAGHGIELVGTTKKDGFAFVERGSQVQFATRVVERRHGVAIHALIVKTPHTETEFYLDAGLHGLNPRPFLEEAERQAHCSPRPDRSHRGQQGRRRLEHASAGGRTPSHSRNLCRRPLHRRDCRNAVARRAHA